MILERFYSMKNKSVIIEGQKVTQGTVTDFDGNFSLNVKPYSASGMTRCISSKSLPM